MATAASAADTPSHHYEVSCSALRYSTLLPTVPNLLPADRRTTKGLQQTRYLCAKHKKIAAGKISRNRRPLTPRTWTVRKRAVFVPQGQGRSLGNSSSSAAKDNSATSSSTHKDSKCPRELGECLDSSVFDFVSIYTRCHRCGRTVALTRAGFRAHGPLRSRCPGRPVS